MYQRNIRNRSPAGGSRASATAARNPKQWQFGSDTNAGQSKSKDRIDPDKVVDASIRHDSDGSSWDRVMTNFPAGQEVLQRVSAVCVRPPPVEDKYKVGEDDVVQVNDDSIGKDVQETSSPSTSAGLIKSVNLDEQVISTDLSTQQQQQQQQPDATTIVPETPATTSPRQTTHTSPSRLKVNRSKEAPKGVSTAPVDAKPSRAVKELYLDLIENALNSAGIKFPEQVRAKVLLGAASRNIESVNPEDDSGDVDPVVLCEMMVQSMDDYVLEADRDVVTQLKEAGEDHRVYLIHRLLAMYIHEL